MRRELLLQLRHFIINYCAVFINERDPGKTSLMLRVAAKITDLFFQLIRKPDIIAVNNSNIVPANFRKPNICSISNMPIFRQFKIFYSRIIKLPDNLPG